jgi:hypothetical protein
MVRNEVFMKKQNKGCGLAEEFCPPSRARSARDARGTKLRGQSASCVLILCCIRGAGARSPQTFKNLKSSHFSSRWCHPGCKFFVLPCILPPSHPIRGFLNWLYCLRHILTRKGVDKTLHVMYQSYQKKKLIQTSPGSFLIGLLYRKKNGPGKCPEYRKPLMGWDGGSS